MLIVLRSFIFGLGLLIASSMLAATHSGHVARSHAMAPNAIDFVYSWFA
jgi:hypothetical protein